jgi:hypothetical protein
MKPRQHMKHKMRQKLVHVLVPRPGRAEDRATELEWFWWRRIVQNTSGLASRLSRANSFLRRPLLKPAWQQILESRAFKISRNTEYDSLDEEAVSHCNVSAAVFKTFHSRTRIFSSRHSQTRNHSGRWLNPGEEARSPEGTDDGGPGPAQGRAKSE